MVAEECRWTPRAKLLHLTSRLEKQAYAFYRSCTPRIKGDFQSLTTELRKRFTPVRIQGVDTSLFHDRKQKPGETVDTYAQELRRLHQKAYPESIRGSADAEKIGKTLLASQFIAGLNPEIKKRATGNEHSDDMDHLLIKARFEEAKLAEAKPVESTAVSRATPNDGTYHQTRNSQPRSQFRAENYKRQGAPQVKSNFHQSSAGEHQNNSYRGPLTCHNCGGVGHFARDCKWRTKRGTGESRASPKTGKMSAIASYSYEDGPRQGISTNATDQPADKIATLRRKLQEAELQEALEQSRGRIHGITPIDKTEREHLGPIVSAEVELEGVKADALLDTGSPATIVSLEFLINARLSQKPDDQSREEWEEYFKKTVQAPDVVLQSYGGNRIFTVGQTEVTIQHGQHSIRAVVQVQRNAPVPVLIGTNLQSALGFRFLQTDKDGSAIDLLKNESVQLQPEGKSTAVCLVRPVHIPGSHERLVEVSANMIPENKDILFESARDDLARQGLSIEDGIIMKGGDNSFVVAVRNYSAMPIDLGIDQVIGNLVPDTHVEEPEEPSEGIDSHINAIRVDSDEARLREVQTLLAVDKLGIGDEERGQLAELIGEFEDIFALNPAQLGHTNIVEHSVNTGDNMPIRQPPRRVPFALRAKVDEMVEEMSTQGVIQPSTSPWASPIVLVTKKDGSTRFCVDYRRLNSVTKKDVHPLPRIDDTLDSLANQKYFTTLDLASGYWQVGMEQQSQEKTAFITHSGLYEFLVMPFGLCNAPATFQRLMEVVLHGLVRKVCLVYLDDILIIGRSFEEHLMNLRQVFNRLRDAGLCLKPSKCQLARTQVVYLGHVISREGIAADPGKVEAVRNYPVPKNLKQLRAFVGLASYYRRFIPDFSAVARPLHTLTRKDTPFRWTEEQRASFDNLKKLMTEAPLLVYADFTKPFILETDASKEGLGAVLAQRTDNNQVHPIAYASRTLLAHEQNYSISELEALGVVWAVKHFRHFLYGHRCEVYTDHVALKALLNTPHPSGKLARWGLALQELDLDIRYRPGKSNTNADALSRAPIQSSDAIIATVASNMSGTEGQETLGNQQRSDEKLRFLIEYLTDQSLPDDEKVAREIVLSSSQYALIDGVLYYSDKSDRLRLVPPSNRRRSLFDEAHQGHFGGHLRDGKVHGQLARHYWWPRMRTDIVNWCRSCLTCARRRIGKPEKPPLIPIPVTGPFDRVGVDVIQFAKSQNGNKYAVVFVDYLTKWPEVFATSDQSALTIAKLLVEHIISRHGVPRELLSDRGPAFLSRLLKEVCTLMGIKKSNTTAYHPQTDGLVERFNRTLTDMLAKTVERDGKNWDIRLPYVLFAYRSSPQESTGESPFYLLYGRDPQLPADESMMTQSSVRMPIDVDNYKEEVCRNMQEAWEVAKKKIRTAQKKQKMCYDRRARDPTFRPGDRAFLYTPSAKSGPAYKFALPYKGPYRVTNISDNVACLQLISNPGSDLVRVSISRLRHCPAECCPEGVVPNGHDNTSRRDDGNPTPLNTMDTPQEGTPLRLERPGPVTEKGTVGDNSASHPWATRLRPRLKTTPGRTMTRTSSDKDGEV